jgi:hypothetical protein
VSTIECGSYITGFAQGIQAAQEAAVVQIVADQVARGVIPPTDKSIDAASKKAGEHLQLFCMRSNWVAGYVQAVVGQYAREHPEALDELAADHMVKVFARAFPCGQAQVSVLGMIPVQRHANHALEPTARNWRWCATAQR